MNKIITVNIPENQLVKVYLNLWNGILGLTEKEILITEALISKYLELKKVIADEKYLYEILFSTQSLKEIRTKVDIKEAMLNNYKSKLKDKRVLLMDDDGNYSLDERVIPVKEITFRFDTI